MDETPRSRRTNRRAAPFLGTRTKIHELLKAGPRTFTDIMQAMGLANGETQHHLDILGDYGLVRSLKVGRTRVYALRVLPWLSMDEKEAMWRTNPTVARILDALKDGPKTFSQLNAVMGKTRQATAYHLRRLEQEGFIVVTGAGRYNRVYARKGAA